jgi:hypothetical protein
MSYRIFKVPISRQTTACNCERDCVHPCTDLACNCERNGVNASPSVIPESLSPCITHQQVQGVFCWQTHPACSLHTGERDLLQQWAMAGCAWGGPSSFSRDSELNALMLSCRPHGRRRRSEAIRGQLPPFTGSTATESARNSESQLVVKYQRDCLFYYLCLREFESLRSV